MRIKSSLYSEGEVYTSLFTGENFSIADIDFSVKKTEICDEYELSFVPHRDISLDFFYLIFDIAENGLKAEDTYYYQSGISTNSFARIVRADNPDTGMGSGRDIFMLKSGLYTFNAAFSTFNRFYTFFMFDKGVLNIGWSLENKKVKKGERYVLERIILNEGSEALSFFESYTALLRDRLGICKMKAVHCGWSSWSCYANGIDEEKILTNAEIISREFADRGASLIQVDDGWQNSTSFDIKWDSNKDSFPAGMKDLCAKLKARGLSLGLWMSAGLISADTENFKTYEKYINRPNGELISSFGNVFPLDISATEIVDKTKEAFLRSNSEYGAIYFKVDFLVNTLCRMGNGESLVFYETDYSVAVYKKFIKAIREAVGEDVFLLACGAPIGESAGIFDAIRTSPDIVWGGAGTPGRPDGWLILVLDCQNAIYRSPYHGKVFINDPDALLTREYGWGDDGLHLTEEEALTRATAVAFSGGHILINDIMSDLSDARKSIFRNIIPPYGKAARPVDFFEYPYSTHTVIDVDEKSTKTEIHALYNWDGKTSVDKVVSFDGRALVTDCHTGAFLGEYESQYVCKGINPHECRALCIKKIESHPFFVYCNENIYLGCGSVCEKYEDGVLKIFSVAEAGLPLFVYIPKEFTGEIYLNGMNVKNYEFVQTLSNGNLCKIFCEDCEKAKKD